MIKVWLFRFAMVIFPLIPRRLGLTLAGLGGDLAYYLAPSARQVVESNMEKVLGADTSLRKVQEMARGVFRNAAKNYFDLFRVPQVNMNKFSSLVSSQGMENMVDALLEGRGVVVVTAHLGNFDVCGQMAAAHSINLTSLVEPLEPPELLDVFVKLRGSKGVKFVPVGPGSLRASVKSLRRGDAVALACDRDIQKTGLEMLFFGEMTSLPQGAAYLALRTGAKVIPAFSERLPDNRFAVYVEPPLGIDRTNDFDADLRTLMAKIARIMEKHIGARPDQWMVFERIWPNSYRGRPN